MLYSAVTLVLYNDDWAENMLRNNNIVDIWSKIRGRSQWFVKPNNADNIDELDDIVAEDLDISDFHGYDDE